jgi:hypothetical protein
MVFSGEILANSSSRRVCTVKTIVIVPRLATRSERTGPKRAGPPSPPALVETVFTYLLDVQWAKICVDQANVANAAVLRKLGSHLAGVGVRAIEAKSLTDKVFVWLQRRFDPMVRAD